MDECNECANCMVRVGEYMDEKENKKVEWAEKLCLSLGGQPIIGAITQCNQFTKRPEGCKSINDKNG